MKTTRKEKQVSAFDFKRQTTRCRMWLCLLCMIAISTQSAFAQNKVKGTVSDENGEPLIGVNILIKGTTNGTITDINGTYEINASSDATLLFTYIGYTDKEVQVKKQSVINVIMKDDSQSLEEVVVVGYGTVKKRDLTGSVSSIGSDKLKERSFGNALQSMAGQVSGVQITQTQGAPGMAPTIKVRGSSSINAGTSPLYVIDGIPLEDNTVSDGSNGSSSNMSFNRNPLNNINPNDIESIEILKDASSAAIYGSRGANGVVLVTTKQGKAGKTKVDASYEFGISRVNRRIDVMDAKEWIDFETAARNNTWATTLKNNPNAVRGMDTVIPEEFSDPEWLARIGNGTDWQDVLFRTAFTHNAQVSASGGSEKTQFMFSAGYLTQEGVVDQNNYDRLSIRSNINHKFNDRLSAGLKIGLTRTNDSSYGTAGKSDAVSLAVQSDPIFPLRVETGSLGFKDPESIWNTFVKYGFQLWHPYSLTREMSKKKTTDMVLVNSFIDYKILDGLNFKMSFNANTEDSHYKSYWNAGQDWGYSGWVDAEANFVTMRSTNWVWENTLNYNKTFNNDHSVTGLVGYTMQEQTLEYSEMTGGSFPNDLVHTINAGKVTRGSTSETEWALISFLARATYSYKGKYLASAALRTDGCSRFGKNNRWGYFPSASIAWRVSEEEFMKDINWLNNLKLRLSYGVTGNNQIPNYGAIGLLGYSSYVQSGTVTQGLYTNTLPDPELKWEKTGQVNFGLDAGLFNNRINLSLDLYYSRTHDLLLDVPVPVLTGFQSTLTNIGKLENKGVEFFISTRNLDGAFTWTTDFNISANRNKVLKLGANDAPIMVTTNDAISKTEVGQPIGNYYGYIFDGVLSQKDIDNGVPVYPGSEAGDPKVRDVTGEGIIDSNDRTIIGNYQPDFTWGMTNNFSYKGIELSVMLTGSQGGEIMNQHSRFLKSFNGNRNAYQSVTNYWRSDENPGDGHIFKPRVTQNTVQAQSSTYWVEDGSFVRIKNIRLGYNFPASVTKRLRLSNLKLYVNLENVYVFSDYSNYDPEGSTFQSGYRVGYDYGSYPNPFTATAGINIGF
ncbi:SusC/RagA family TonB-linked outer membrane protein [Phocaeicola sp.]|jgi:TonB-linked SusC/RagA family outer membrane protein